MGKSDRDLTLVKRKNCTKVKKFLLHMNCAPVLADLLVVAYL